MHNHLKCIFFYHSDTKTLKLGSVFVTSTRRVLFELNGDGDASQNVPTLARFAEVAEFTHLVGKIGEIGRLVCT